MNPCKTCFVKRLILALVFSAFTHLTAAAQGVLFLCTSESQCGAIGQCRETFKIDETKKKLFRILEIGGKTAEIPLTNIKWSESVMFGEFRELGESPDGVVAYVQFTFKRLSGDMERFDSIYRTSNGNILNQDELIRLEADRIGRFGPILGRIGNTRIDYFKCEKSVAKF
jgi:hypothetical protein